MPERSVEDIILDYVTLYVERATFPDIWKLLSEDTQKAIVRDLAELVYEGKL